MAANTADLDIRDDLKSNGDGDSSDDDVEKSTTIEIMTKRNLTLLDLKTANQDCCLTPRCLHHCGLDTAFY